MVVLKLKVEPSVFARLFDELKKERNQLQIIAKIKYEDTPVWDVPLVEDPQNFVTILPGERKFDGEFTEITLKLAETYPDADEDGQNPPKYVDREMVERLFDLLEIFPRAPKPKSVFTDEELGEIIVGIDQAANAAHKSLDRIPLTHEGVDDVVSAKAEVHRIRAHCTQFGLKYGVRTEK